MIKKLSITNLEEYINLAHEVVNNLDNREFLIPCSDEDLKNILKNDNVKIYGYYQDDKLIASAQLSGEDGNKELGGFLTLPDYRENGIMKKLCAYILENNDYFKIIITVHPNNIPSKKVIESLNAKYVCNTLINNYERDVCELKNNKIGSGKNEYYRSKKIM